MNWAKQRAEDVADGFSDAVGNGRLRRELVDAIAADIQRVADECAETVDEAPCYRATGPGRENTRRSTSMDFANDIRAKFPKEQS